VDLNVFKGVSGIPGKNNRLFSAHKESVFSDKVALVTVVFATQQGVASLCSCNELK
jgi:hypothetical protein